MNRKDPGEAEINHAIIWAQLWRQSPDVGQYARVLLHLAAERDALRAELNERNSNHIITARTQESERAERAEAALRRMADGLDRIEYGSSDKASVIQQMRNIIAAALGNFVISTKIP